MGMFTTIKDGQRSWQIKCGYDQCEEYNVGDKVDQEIEPCSPGSGKLLDDVYDGYPCGDHPAIWVVIKDGLVSLHDMDNGGYPIGENEYYMLKKKLGVLPPDPSMWTDAVWAKKAKRQYLRECEQETDKADDYGLSQEALSRKHGGASFLRATLRQPGFIRSILPPRGDQPEQPEPAPKFDYYWNNVPTRLYDQFAGVSSPRRHMPELDEPAQPD